MDMKDQIVESLKEVYDPEIPINVYDLGLIYNIEEKENGRFYVLMTLTSPTCPTADYLKEQIMLATEKVVGEGNVDLELTFEPKWTPDRVSNEAKEELGLDTTPKEDLALQNTFTGVNDPIRENICFNCGTSDRDMPIVKCQFKGEETQICTRCMSKF